MSVKTSYRELLADIKRLKKVAERTRRKELATIISEVKGKIRKYGLTASDLGLGSGRGSARKATRKRKKVAPKYRDPKSGKTWSGRGRPPLWVVEAEKAGKSRESFLIKK